MNCIDDECKYLLSDWHCSLTNEEVPDDIDVTQCENYVQARTCINCVYSRITVYETGAIDDIEYRCPFQENKLIYDDLDVYNAHYADVPECNIEKFENEAGQEIPFPYQYLEKYMLGEMTLDDAVNSTLDEVYRMAADYINKKHYIEG